MKRILYVLTFLLLSFEGFSTQSFFQNIHALYSSEPFELKPSEIYTLSSSEVLSLSDILLAKEIDFKRLDRTKGFKDENTVWSYFQLINKTSTPIELVIEGGRNAQETYYIIADSITTIKKAGYYFASTERDIQRGYTTKVKVALEPDQLTKFYVAYNNQNGLPVEVRFEGIDAQEWELDQKNLILFEGIFTGIIVLIITLNIFIYGFTKETVCALFGAYALFNIIYFLHIHGFVEILLFPTSPDKYAWLWLLPFLTAGAYFLFTREFLELKDEKPSMYRITTLMGYSSVVLFLLSSIYLYFTGNIFHATLILNSFILLSAVLALVLVYIAFTMKSVVSNYFAIGTSLLMITVIIAVVNQLFYLSNAVPVFVQYGIIIEIIVFSIGLSHKLKKDYDDHLITQQSLILQLTKADKIQKSKTQELEEIVAERTQEVKEQNIELIEARSQAERATKSKSDFLSVMSHEIRTPLNAIISLSHIMELDNKDEEMSEYIDALKFSAEGLHSLINDILDYNKIEAGKLKLESIEFSLLDLMKNVRQSFKYKANSKGVDLQIEIGEHLPDKYLGDPTRLTQIFNNLISNGIKFTEEGYVKLKAELIGIKDNMASVQFEVTDTGIGIPQNRLKSIFEEFEQATTATTRNYGGTGLGLSITQKLLDMMDTEILIESEEGKGSSFSFNLEFEICQEFDLVNLQLSDRTKDLKSANIMVVDDNDMNRLVLKRLLDIWNANFIDMNNGVDAIDFVENNEVHLILMDLQMQPIDGFEATRKINKINPELPIIAMSANQPNDFEDDYYKTGFSSFVSKPFDPEDLFNQMAKLLQP